MLNLSTYLHLEAATMGNCLELPSASQPKGSLTYPQSNLTKLAAIKDMETGRKPFGSNNELTTEPKGETCFSLRDNGARKEAWRTQKGKQQENNPKSTR